MAGVAREIPVVTAALAVHDLHVSYAGAGPALRGVSLEVADGGVTAVLGSNGAGKTTLLRALSGTLRSQRGTITRGTIEFAGRNLAGAHAADIARSGLVQVPEGRRVFGTLTVEENLRAGGLAARDKHAARARVDELFPILRERRSQRAALLSGGEQQMLAIGRALMASPRVLLLDEPSLGLAPRIVEQLAEVIREINRQGSRSCWSSRTRRWRSPSPSARSCSRSARSRSRAPPTSWRRARRCASATSGPPSGRRRHRSSRTPRSSWSTVSASASAASRALSEVSFTVAPGSMHALIGPNGAGKSTCLNVLSGVYEASAGSARYGGRELTGLKPHRIAALGVSRTFQNIALSPRVSVLDNLLVARHRLMRSGFVADGLRLPRARRERAEHEARVREIAGLLDLEPVLARPVGTLSYGTRKRVELARALCAEPKLLLLDEPVAGMVRDESEAMAAAIANARTELGISVLLVEHDMAFVMGIADRVTVLDFGRRIADGTPEEIQRDPEVLRAYLGGAA